jgi:hypothetical protein
LGEGQLVADELVGFDELVLLWFGDGSHRRISVKGAGFDRIVSGFYRRWTRSGSDFAGIESIVPTFPCSGAWD